MFQNNQAHRLVKNTNQNKYEILKIIIQNKGISRKEISDITGLTRSAITRNVNSLIEDEIVCETESRETGNIGRKEIGLSVCPGKNAVITLDCGRLSLECTVFDLTGEEIFNIKGHKGLFSFNNSDEASDEIEMLLKKVIRKTEERHENIIGIGISVLSSVYYDDKEHVNNDSRENHRTYSFGWVPWGWNKLKERLEENLQMNVFIENQANILALGELWFGKGKGTDNFTVVSYGMGFGGGAVINGTLFRGDLNTVGEIGHIPIIKDGPECYCGQKGCLESYVIPDNMIRQYYLKKGEQKELPADYSEIAAELKKLFDDAYNGDPDASGIISEFAWYISLGCIMLINTFGSRKMIFSFYELDELDNSLLYNEIKKNIEEKSFYILLDKLEIAKSRPGRKSYLLGAFSLVVDDYFSNRI